MAQYSEALQALIDTLTRLPGVGTRTAERLALHLVNHPQQARELAHCIRRVTEQVRRCRDCYNLTEGTDQCAICADPSRDRDVLCVVEQPRDVVAIESSGAYRGVYHVLGGRIAPLEGVGPESLTIDALERRVREARPREVLIATSPTTEGDTTASYLVQLLEPYGVQLTRLARGVVPGSTLEIATPEMLASAIRDRRAIETVSQPGGKKKRERAGEETEGAA